MKKWIILLTISFIVEPVRAQSDDLEHEIPSLMQEYGAIGLSVAVVKDGRIIYENTFGVKDRENAIPLCTDDLFRIASITKTFVTTAIMQLVEKRKLSLDDDVSKYLTFKVQNPQYPDTPITIKMLLCHRSSINDSQGYKTFDSINPSTNAEFPKCYSDNRPGEKYAYSNLNYNLLGAIIENVTGTRFDKYIRKHILRPLKLHGRFDVQALNSKRFAHAYRYRAKEDSLYLSKDTYLPYCTEIKNYTLGYSVPYLSAAGGLKITAKELARYMMMHMNYGIYKRKHIISKESEFKMREVPVPNHWYALSITHYKNVIPDEELFGQTGGAYGIHTAMIFHPTKNYGFIVFCNGCKCKSANGQELNFKMIKTLYKKLIK